MYILYSIYCIYIGNRVSLPLLRQHDGDAPANHFSWELVGAIAHAAPAAGERCIDGAGRKSTFKLVEAAPAA
jgi:hypothetical protein